MRALFLTLRHYFYNYNVMYCIRMIVALGGAAIFAYLIGNTTYAIPLTLGVVAAALTDLDDRLTGRLQNLLLILLCFFFASVSVQLLLPYPGLFVCSLWCSTFVFILLGALGQQYFTIAFGALLIAIYTMLGHNLYSLWYLQPLLLLAGTFWYNLVTLLEHIVLPIRPVQQQVALCYLQLSNYFNAKSALFDPDQEGDFHSQKIALSLANKELLNQLESTKQTLLTRLKGDRGQKGTRVLLHYYYIAQDVYEQISSTHAQYQSLSQALRYSDILFRFQHILMLQANACRRIMQSIIWLEPYQHDAIFERSFQHLQKTISQHEQAANLAPQIYVSLHHLYNNLQNIDKQLANVTSTIAEQMDNNANQLVSEKKTLSLQSIWFRIKQQLTPQSVLFRHAVRMSIVLVTGYLIVLFIKPDNGYWIMLTSLFVCQPNYSATRNRLILRIVGTLAGVLLSLPILYLVPTESGKLILIVLSGTLFFVLRNIRYASATAFITLMVMLCFSLLGEGSNIAISRIIDTLLGCGIAWLAVNYIWPDWKFRHIENIVTRLIDNNNQYIKIICQQYQKGRNNSPEYQLCRYNAQNSDAELTAALSAMTLEPQKQHQLIDACFNLLSLNQTLLGYISALGSHRELLPPSTTLFTIISIVEKWTQIMTRQTVTDDEIQRLEHLLSQVESRFPVSQNNKLSLLTQQIRLVLSITTNFISSVNEVNSLK